jgi:hypothetical protein
MRFRSEVSSGLDTVGGSVAGKSAMVEPPASDDARDQSRGMGAAHHP